ncbi:MAG: OmpA family protein [Bacteroidales bacterium]|nr:OmpA family protein [Bacteroidales bacterium]
MKLSITLILSFIFIVNINVIAQKNHAESADIAFKDQKYSIAVDKYKKAYSKIKRNREEKNRVKFQIAECYRYMNNTKRAEANYRGLVRNKYYKHKPLILLYYADALRANEKYEDAIVQYDEYNKLKPEDPRGANGAEACSLSIKWRDNPTNHQLTNIRKINSKEDDFSPAYLTDQYNSIVFTSNREGATGKASDDWTGENFTDLFFARKDRKDEWSTPVLLEDQGIINTETNEGSSMLNQKFNIMYFTRCGNAKGKKSGCHIYKTKKQGRNWNDPEIIPLGGDSTSAIGHPTLSNDELTIIFVADFDGGYGLKDIWYATRKSKNDDFGRPKNIGPVINTVDEDMFPFLRSDTVLYFASNGHIGMGGFDLYKSTKTNDEWGAPVNLKPPLNSSADDFSIIFNPEAQEEGYFSSNRKEGGKGGDDIWYFIEPPLEFTLTGTIKDDRSLQYIVGAEVKLIGSDGTSIIDKSNSLGIYEFTKEQFLPNTSYELIISKNNYFNTKGSVTTVGVDRSKDFVRDFVLVPIPKKPIILPEILYDLAKWDLKPQYQDSLQGLIQTLDENETIVVELASHTDLRDTDENNDILSQKRAQSVVDYLILRGIDPDRLVAKGYGERVPRSLENDYYIDGNKIFDAKKTLTESFINSLSSNELKEIAHQLNRRTEFTVIRNNFVPKPKIEDVTSPKIDIVLNPEEEINAVKFIGTKDGKFVIPGIFNGYSMDFILDKITYKSYISLNSALELLKNGAISKTDFQGDPNEILANASIIDKAVFTIKDFKILKNTIHNIEVIVSYKLEHGFIIDEKTFSKFGKYTIDKEKKEIIFE